MKHWAPWLLVACATPPPAAWDAPLGEARAQAHGADALLVVFVALPGRELSDRMEQQALRDPRVLEVLRRHAYVTARIDGFRDATHYAQWIGSGEGMGIAVLDPAGLVGAARPGPQDAPELAAFLEQAAQSRAALAELRRNAPRSLARAELLVELGCRREAEPLLRQLAAGGDPRAALLLALLLGQDGRLLDARAALAAVPAGPERDVVDGYICFKERRHAEAVAILERVPSSAVPARERWRAALYRGKALAACGRTEDALAVLQVLAEDARGTTFAGAAEHALTHILDPDHGHAH